MSEPLDLDALEALAEAATPGPWVEHLDEFYSHIIGGDPDEPIDLAHVGSKRADAAFIAAARTAVPTLVKRLRWYIGAGETLTETVADLRARLEAAERERDAAVLAKEHAQRGVVAAKMLDQSWREAEVGRDALRDGIEQALLNHEHADTCGKVLSPEADYPCSCWRAALRSLIQSDTGGTNE